MSKVSEWRKLAEQAYQALPQPVMVDESTRLRPSYDIGKPQLYVYLERFGYDYSNGGKSAEKMWKSQLIWKEEEALAIARKVLELFGEADTPGGSAS